MHTAPRIGTVTLLHVHRFQTSLGCDVAELLTHGPEGLRLMVTLSCPRQYIRTDRRPRKKRKS